MKNDSITARAVNPNLFEINQAKTRVSQAKKRINQAKKRVSQAKTEGKQLGHRDAALVETVVTNYFATARHTEAC